MAPTAFCRYLKNDGIELFTVVCLPDEKGSYPTVIQRNPYVDAEEPINEQELCEQKMKDYSSWLAHGYAVVFQHCRGRGKSSGDFVPYIYEREDGLFLQNWIREQAFYNGEIYLYGSSYLSSVHFVTAPFAEDIKGAVLEIQDCERYNIAYRNGFFKMGLHGSWYVRNYKTKSHLKKNYSDNSFRMLPLSLFSKTVLGENAADLDETLSHPKREDDFWSTRFGGGEAHEAVKNANIPILFVTGFYDIYTGGVFDMWKGLDEGTRAQCALLVHPYDHYGGTRVQVPIDFENGYHAKEYKSYALRFIDSIRGKCESPIESGKVTYYHIFDGQWHCDSFADAPNVKKFTLGKGKVTYLYNPFAPASFKGGLSSNFGGAAWQDAPNSRYDIVSFYTPAFEEDTTVKGKMKARLKVSSDCEDTCFYIRLSLCKEEGDYGLRDDINQISNFDQAYRPNEEIEMDFSFDEHAFVIKKGEKIRIDISSSAFPYYVPHTNQRGLFSEQTTAKIAHNTVILEDSYIELPTEKHV